MAALKQFRSIQTTDKTLNLIQDQLQDLFKGICANPLVFGMPLPQVKFAPGLNIVSHGLGRNFDSCFVGIMPAVLGSFGSDVGTFGSNPAPFGTPSDAVGSPLLAIANVQPDRSKFVAIIAIQATVCDLFVF